MSKYDNKKINITHLMLLLLLGVSSFGCRSEVLAPGITLEGESLDNGRVAAWDSKLYVFLHIYTLKIDSEEILRTFNLPAEGDFWLNTQLRDARAGQYVLDYNCHCDMDTHRIYISIDLSDKKLLVTLSDSIAGNKQILSSKQYQETASEGGTYHSSDSAINKIDFTVSKGFLHVPDKGKLNLSKIVHGGEWSKVDYLAYKDYDGVIQWQCRPEINTQGSASCYCGINPELPDIHPDPTCRSNYTREAYLAFKLTDSNKVKTTLFESNFSSGDIKILRKSWGAPDEIALHLLDKKQ